MVPIDSAGATQVGAQHGVGVLQHPVPVGTGQQVTAAGRVRTPPTGTGQHGKMPVSAGHTIDARGAAGTAAPAPDVVSAATRLLIASAARTPRLRHFATFTTAIYPLFRE